MGNSGLPRRRRHRSPGTGQHQRFGEMHRTRHRAGVVMSIAMRECGFGPEKLSVGVGSVCGVGQPFGLAQLARSDEPARPDPRRRRPNRRAPSGLLLPTLPTITKPRPADRASPAAAAAVAANAFSSVVKRGDHRRRSFELLAKPSVLVVRAASFRAATRAGGTIDCRTPFPQNGFRAVDGGDRTSWRVQSGRGTSPDASVT